MTHYRPRPPSAARSRRGFALIAVLWVITALAALLGVALATTRLGTLTTRNRVLLARDRWAAEACLAIAAARWADHQLADTATIELGRSTRCRWLVEDPAAKLNVNTADPEVLRALLTSLAPKRNSVDSFVAGVVERRRRDPLTDARALTGFPGFDTAWSHVLTVDGAGTINLSAAPAAILAVLPGMTPEAVERVLRRRTFGPKLTDLDALAADLSPPARARLLESYPDLARQVATTPPQLLVFADGWVAGQVEDLRATIELLVVPLEGRLAVIRRRSW